MLHILGYNDMLKQALMPHSSLPVSAPNMHVFGPRTFFWVIFPQHSLVKESRCD